MRTFGRLRLRVATALLGLLALCGSLLAGCNDLEERGELDRLAGAPRRILWAWERPENLTFIDPGSTGVAFWAGTVGLRGSAVEVTPRLQPLVTPASAWRAAVVRIESDLSKRPELDAVQLARTLDSVLSLVGGDEDGLQIDFDALASERDFYSRLLTELRAALEPAMPLSITALASWCLGDSWLSELPIDDAVPMLFRMGRDGPSIRRFLDQGGDFTVPVCRGSLGLATDEPAPPIQPSRRVYLFHPRSWSESAARAALTSADVGSGRLRELAR